MHKPCVSDDRKKAVEVFGRYDRTVLPVVDDHGRLAGIVTLDDVLDIAEEEATRDLQKFGGLEALDEPYMSTSLASMIRKRATWLVILFVGEMFTATAMGYFEDEIATAVVLALFIPLIISSGGNSGSQAATLIIRALALGEVGIRDWWRVMRREIIAGLLLGSDPRPDRFHPDRRLERRLAHLRTALVPGRPDSRLRSGRRGGLGHADRLDASLVAQSDGLRPRDVIGPIRRDPGRRDRPGHLFQRRQAHPSRHGSVSLIILGFFTTA